MSVGLGGQRLSHYCTGVKENENVPVSLKIVSNWVSAPGGSEIVGICQITKIGMLKVKALQSLMKVVSLLPPTKITSLVLWSYQVATPTG